ncbi:MAG: PEP-CTERM sorting domain-containing protein [Phycisphaerae bacterium]|jgi:MYXO-CTERM domain-containing protein
MTHKLIPLVAVVFCAGTVFGDVLWDQSDLYTDAFAAYEEENVGNDEEYSSYVVDDVEVGETGWNIETVSTYMTNFTSDWSDISQARLNIIPKDGLVPSNTFDPRDGTLVPVTATEVSGYYCVLKITADSLDITLTPGQYWIGLTPLVDTTYGLEGHVATETRLLDEPAWRNPAGGWDDYMSLGTDWIQWGDYDTEWRDYYYDSAFMVTGTPTPEPASLALIALGALALRRRS